MIPLAEQVPARRFFAAVGAAATCRCGMPANVLGWGSAAPGHHGVDAVVSAEWLCPDCLRAWDAWWAPLPVRVVDVVDDDFPALLGEIDDARDDFWREGRPVALLARHFAGRTNPGVVREAMAAAGVHFITFHDLGLS